MSLVKLKDAVDFDSENGMCNHIHNVNHKETIDEICNREIIVKPVYQADFFCGKYRNLRSIENNTYNRC